MTTPIRIRFSLTLSAGLLAVGLLLLVYGVLSGRLPNAVLGGLFVLLGGLQLTGVAVVVEAAEVQLKNPLRMTVRRTPIAGLGDLRLDGPKLVRVSDGRKITSVSSMSVRSADVEMLRTAITAAGAGAGAPA